MSLSLLKPRSNVNQHLNLYFPQTFKSKEPLSAVRLYIQLNRDDVPSSNLPVKLMTNFPKKVFTEEDFEKPLDQVLSVN